MPFEPTYRVVPHEGGYAVAATTMSGAEFVCTVATSDRARAEQWCRRLRAAAQVETDRKKDVIAGKRSREDA
jgi:hypothetical protein